MLHEFSVRLSKHIVTQSSSLTEDQTDLIRYAIETMLGELSKLVILSLLFGIANSLGAFWISFLYFSILRLLAGGFHFKTYFSCLIGSAVMYGAIILGASFSFIPLSLALITSIIILHRYTPVIPLNRRELIADTVRKKRVETAIAVSTLFAFSLYAGQLQLFTYTLFIFSLQLWLGGFRNETVL